MREMKQVNIAIGILVILAAVVLWWRHRRTS
jgi:hypothetical protein